MKNMILKYVNKPEADVLSSQTLYESLMATINLYEITNNANWKVQSKYIANLIMKTQLSNGGFDIGYDFMFGKDLSKKYHQEATTPEVVSIFALYKYGEVFGFDEVQTAIDKGIGWILNNTIEIPNGKYAIPYAPHSYSKVHITNAVSFTIGVLSYYLKFNQDLKVLEIYNGMIRFMKEEMEHNDFGYYWPYFYQNGSPDELKLTNDKIDNYHIGQQLRYHSAAYINVPTDENYEIIKKISMYLTNKIDSNGILSYTEKQGKSSSKIDLWGYSSVIKGLLEAHNVIEEKILVEKANLMLSFILNNSWNGEYFFPILDKEGSVFDSHFYPRSDAWVLHSLTVYMKSLSHDEEIYKICEMNYEKICKEEFRGLENHTLTRRKRIFARLVYALKKLINREGK